MRSSKLAALLSTAALAVSAFGAAAAPAHASTLDTDGDKLLDVWETQGFDRDGDGVIDIDFPAMGANPYKKDLFVEMDWMPRKDGGIELAPEADLDRIVEVFANYPVRNPDGTTGINLHLDAGNARSAKYNLGGGNQVEYHELPNHLHDLRTIKAKDGNFDPKRAGVFYYMIWADKYGTNSSSGLAWSPGMEFLVTVGQTYYRQGSSNIRVGTFIHEFGHNLGLGHGGSDNVNNKPQYLSVMNYAYQFNGVPKVNGKNHFGFSIRAGMTLDENAFSEARGLGPAASGYTYTNRNFSITRALAHLNLDVNKNGVIDPVPLKIDLNNDGSFTRLTAPNDLMLLKFQSGLVRGGAVLEEEHIHDHDHDHAHIEFDEATAEDAEAVGALPSE